MDAVAKVKEYIQAGDIFQLVLSHRFKRRTFADPFEIYRWPAGFLSASRMPFFTLSLQSITQIVTDFILADAHILK